MAKKEEPAVKLVNDGLAKCKDSHDNLVTQIESLYKAYRGQVELRSEAASWTSKYHPPYILQMIESMVAAIADPTPKVRIKPRPKIGDDYAAAILGAKTLQSTVNYALDVDRWAEKQRAWILQALICKLSVAKVYWHKEERDQKSLRYVSRPVMGPAGLIDTVPMLEEHSQVGTYKDGPCIEVVDIRDFMWPESSIDVQSAPEVFHRIWVPAEHAKAYAASYGVNVEDVDSSYWTPSNEERESYLGSRSRTKGLIPVVERWTNERCIIVMNSRILLKDSDSGSDPGFPFWHGQKPFVVASAMPEPFQFAGISVVEIVQHLQEMLWSLQNQRIDSVRLMSNMIMLARADLADIDMFEWAPGAIWPVEDASQFKPLEINPAIASLTLDAEALIKTDLRDIPGGDLFSGGTGSQALAGSTATQASLVSSIAQRLVQARKDQFRYAGARIVEQVGSNCQQFYREPQLIEIVGQGADPSFLEVDPGAIQGRYDYIAEMGDESLIRQERRAEYGAMLSTLIQGAQAFAQAGVQINYEALLKDYFEEGFDITDASQYLKPFSLPGMPQGQAPLPGQEGQGVTSPLASGPLSPSNDQSLNPAVAMARMGAQNGGSYNA